jgi:hypothetical protein
VVPSRVIAARHRVRRGSPAMHSHQPDQAVFRSVRPDDIDWKLFPAFPAAARLAIVVGQPGEPGPYVIRVKVPSGVKLMPHWHPEDRVYTVISSVFYIGLGREFDGENPGSPPARGRHRPAWRHASFSLGEIR